MRGTQSVFRRVGHFVGIIPAYAGNTWVDSAAVEGHGDHPRVCGEHSTGWPNMVNAWGSSPRMRGTRHHGLRRHTRLGIIPAYAGNTRDRQAHTSTGRDHPRVCGEHNFIALDPAEGRGSSPRMRGTHDRLRPGPQHRGIIPAYAGNTTW